MLQICRNNYIYIYIYYQAFNLKFFQLKNVVFSNSDKINQPHINEN